MFLNLRVIDHATSDFVFEHLLKVNYFETTEHTSIKHNTIYHHTKLRVTGKLLTSQFKTDYLKISFLTEKTDFRLKHENFTTTRLYLTGNTRYFLSVLINPIRTGGGGGQFDPQGIKIAVLSNGLRSVPINPRPFLGWIEKDVGLPGGPSHPGHFSPFFAVLLPERPQKGSTQLLQSSFLSSLFSYLSLVRLRLLIFLFLLMSSNVYPNSGLILPCSVCAGIVTWRGRSVRFCTCSKWVHLRCSLFTLSKLRTLGSFYSWSCPPAASLLVIL